MRSRSRMAVRTDVREDVLTGMHVPAEVLFRGGPRRDRCKVLHPNSHGGLLTRPATDRQTRAARMFCSDSGVFPRAPGQALLHPAGGLGNWHFRFRVWICLRPFGAITANSLFSGPRRSTRKRFLLEPASHESSVAHLGQVSFLPFSRKRHFNSRV